MDIRPEALIEKMAGDLRRLMEVRGIDAPVMIGVRTGGVWIAERLHAMLGLDETLGILDINFYRDDFSRIGLYPQVQPSIINTPLDNRHIVLVDDVLHTGRTVCAALNEIADYGRPAAVTLVVMLDRGGRELPVSSDVCGDVVEFQPGQQVKLRGPDPLSVEIVES